MKKYRLEFVYSVEKDLRNIPKNTLKTIFAYLTILQDNPFVGKPLKGKYKGLYSLRFQVFRIIYMIEKSRMVVLVLRIRHRKDAYKGKIW